MNFRDINKKEVAKFFLLPGIIPLSRQLFLSGFGHVAFFMAQVLSIVKLIPTGHPYLKPSNMGRYTASHVLAEARNNLSFKRENSDQIILFGLILIGAVLLLVQCAFLMFGLVSQAAHAANMPTNFEGFFGRGAGSAPTTNDISFILLDRVFGLENFFNSCVAQQTVCLDNMAAEPPYPYPFHGAFRMMLQMYSIGLLVVAALIFLYFVAAVTIETAQSGTPFGRRFNHVWAPLRMVAALGLLIPISTSTNGGLNSAQWVLMYSAKWGSNFATNGWNIFVDTAVAGDNTPLGGKETLVASPNLPPLNTLMGFATILGTCKASMKRIHKTTRTDAAGNEVVIEREVNAWLQVPDNTTGSIYQMPATYQQARNLVNAKDIEIFFGQRKGSDILAWCGSARMQITDINDVDSPGSQRIMEAWYDILYQIWLDVDGATDCAAPTGLGNAFGGIGECYADVYLSEGNDPTSRDEFPTSGDLSDLRSEFETQMRTAIDAGIAQQRGSQGWIFDQRRLGWAGAAVWYNKIAHLNGQLIAAANNVPVVSRFPTIMHEVEDYRTAHNSSASGGERFNPTMSNEEKFSADDDHDEQIAVALYETSKLWEGNYTEEHSSGNIFLIVINMIFGTEGLFNIHQNAEQGLHPLAMLTVIGKNLMESTVRNVFAGATSGGLGLALDRLGFKGLGSIGQAAGGFAFQVMSIGLMIGFILYYVVPFLPFIYFFFAVGGWIKGLFEAMVGVPLWALAHIRIDGQGFSGDAALGGYFLILEVFLRPILIIFGFIGGITILSAQVRVLNDIWSLVTSNLAGFDETCTDAAGTTTTTDCTSISDASTGSWRYMRQGVDTLFFTIIYTIIVYMLALSSFKLVNLIPNFILRWMGAQVSTFGEQNADAAQNIVRNTTVGGQIIGGGLQQAAGSAQQIGGRLLGGGAPGGAPPAK
jgi:conjugal transfer/type IV secretion protein DotA/TraY